MRALVLPLRVARSLGAALARAPGVARSPGVVLALALSLALPAAHAGQARRSGWAINRLLAGPKFTGTATAIHCGVTKLGTYTLRTTQTYTSGSFKGKTLRQVVTVPLVLDNRRHAFHLITIDGSAVKSLKPAQQRELKRTLAVGFSKFAVRTLALDGTRLTIELWDHGVRRGTGHAALAATSC
jgi:hypothetical protein